MLGGSQIQQLDNHRALRIQLPYRCVHVLRGYISRPSLILRLVITSPPTSASGRLSPCAFFIWGDLEHAAMAILMPMYLVSMPRVRPKLPGPASKHPSRPLPAQSITCASPARDQPDNTSDRCPPYSYKMTPVQALPPAKASNPSVIINPVTRCNTDSPG